MSNKIDFTTFGFGNYSLNEQDTGFTWLNGEHIYSKTVYFGTLPSNEYKEVVHGIVGLDYVVDFSAMSQDISTTERRWRPLNIPNTNFPNYAIVEFSSTSIYMYCGADKSGQTAYVTIYYTKSS